MWQRLSNNFYHYFKKYQCHHRNNVIRKKNIFSYCEFVWPMRKEQYWNYFCVSHDNDQYAALPDTETYRKLIEIWLSTLPWLWTTCKTKQNLLTWKHHFHFDSDFFEKKCKCDKLNVQISNDFLFSSRLIRTDLPSKNWTNN